jgi:hypothetical protein
MAKRGIVDLHLEASRDDCLVFLAHCLRHRKDLFLFVLVIAILHESGTADDAPLEAFLGGIFL